MKKIVSATVHALAGVILMTASHVRAQAQAPAQTSRWESAIQEFEARDRTNPPPRGGILFVGSSTIRMWSTLPQDFPGLPVINRGFGGSAMADLVQFADRIILPYAPRQILVYEGDNDLGDGKTPEQVFADFQALVARIHAKLPQARVVFISIKPSPHRWHLADRMRTANALVKNYVAHDSRLGYIDVFTPMLDADGRPRLELYGGDGLHMTARGYALWKDLVAPSLARE